MPWSETTAMEERRRFVLDALSGCFSMTELCELNRVSRPTGYKWIERFLEGGEEGLIDRSRRPLSSPGQTPPALIEQLVGERGKHPSWGPKKLIRVLAERFPGRHWPAISTAGAILKRHGLIQHRRRRQQNEHPGYRAFPVTTPNQLWTSDFKGQFRTRDSLYCYPLTVADQFSRFVLGCEALDSTAHAQSKKVFEKLFRRYGLPEAILTDNGGPFASSAIGRFSRLSVWWIRLGIRPITIQPGKPQQNGSHERMHRTLKQETTRPPAANRHQQQRAFDRFRLEFNHVRPHEALAQTPPARHYCPSPRPFPSTLPPLDYPGHFEIRRVGSNGCLRWKGKFLHLSQTLVGQDVGFEEVDNQVWSVHFGPVILGRLDESKKTIYPVRR